MKRMLLAASLALGGVLSAAPALAQSTFTDTVSQFQVSPSFNVCPLPESAASFSGQATGQLPGTFKDTFCYIGPQPGPNVKETIVGGPWTLEGSSFALTGTFCNGGTIQWNASGLQGAVTAPLVVRGSTCGAPTGTGSLTGTWSRLYSPGRFNGTLTITL